MNKKGIVLSPSFRPLPSGRGLKLYGTPSPLDIRKYLLYWDEIDYPSNNLIETSSGDIDYLMQTKALKRTFVQFKGEVINTQGEFFIAAQELALKKNQENEPGCWNLAQLSGIPFYTDNRSGLAVDFELYGMLPVPTQDTPLADILEFKHKRHDELMAFRIHLDDIYQKIVSSSDIPRSKNAELARLQMSIKDLDRTLRDGAIKRSVTSIRNTINVDFSGIVGAGLGAAGVSSIIGMPPLLAGMAGAGLVIAYRSFTLPSPNRCPAPLNYIQSIRRNFSD